MLFMINIIYFEFALRMLSLGFIQPYKHQVEPLHKAEGDPPWDLFCRLLGSTLYHHPLGLPFEELFVATASFPFEAVPRTTIFTHAPQCNLPSIMLCGVDPCFLYAPRGSHMYSLCKTDHASFIFLEADPVSSICILLGRSLYVTVTPSSELIPFLEVHQRGELTPFL